jgi:hypothetical protein
MSMEKHRFLFAVAHASPHSGEALAIKRQSPTVGES